MSLTLKIVSENRQALGQLSEKTFGQAGGTIGRSLEADWSLPDGQRFLSSKHASIDFRSGSYYIVDTSKNGVFVNDAEQPVGRGKPQRLFTGDRIRIGDYLLQVSIANVDDTRETLLDTGHVDPVDRKQRVEAPEPTSYDLIDAETITGVNIEIFVEDEDGAALKPLHDKYRRADSTGSLRLVEETPAPAAAAPAKPAPTPTPTPTTAIPDAPKFAFAKPAAPILSPPAPSAPKPAVTKPAAAQPGPARPAPAKTGVAKPAPATPAPATPAPATPAGLKPAAAEAAARQPLEAFFRGARIDMPNLTPRQAEQFMTQLGQVTRELIVGVIDGLHLRAVQKAQLKQSNTTIQPLDNNRLKFAANVEEGFAKLFSDQSELYQTPVDSVRNAFADLKHHQRALLAATRRAVDEYLDRFEPGQIEGRAGVGGIGGALLGAANKLKYWDLYKDVYSILANRGSDEMPQAFLDELSNAYADEIAKHAPRPASNAATKEAG
jgi:type VI secretion system protein